MQFTRRPTHRRVAEVNMTPLIDLFLNILVFFLVTTTFATESIFYVELPEAKTGETAVSRKLITIEIGPAGTIAVDGQPSTIQGLRDNLATVPEAKRQTIPVVLRADRGARHGRIVSVIDVVRDAGLRNVGIATQAVIKE